MNKIWTLEEEAENLAARFAGVNRAKFARENKIKGGAVVIYQHIKGITPISLGAALIYAKAFNCGLDEISPRLNIEIIGTVTKTTIEAIKQGIKKLEGQDFDIKDYSQFTDNLNDEQKAQIHDLLTYFTVLSDASKKHVIELASAFYNAEDKARISEQKVKDMMRKRAHPNIKEEIIEGTDNGKPISEKKARVSKLS